MSEYFTIRELAVYSRMSVRFLRQLIAGGKLTHYRSGGRGKLLVRQQWWDDYVDAQVRAAEKSAQEAIHLVRELVGR